MPNRGFTLLENAVLGLIHEKPSSGYDLRKTFATTPIGSFSDSPGAIYPALKRLERDGMIRGRREKGSSRRRQIFELTDRGRTALNRWLETPLTRDDVVSGMNDLMLRFAFTEGVLGANAAVRLLEALQHELEEYVPTLCEFLRMHAGVMQMSAALALESGIRGYEAQLQWARDAIARFREKGSKHS